MNSTRETTAEDPNQRLCNFIERDLGESDGRKTMRDFFLNYLESSKRSLSNRKVYSVLKINLLKVEVVNVYIISDDYNPISSSLTKSSWFVHISKLLLSLNKLLDHFKNLGIGFDDLKLSAKDFHPVIELQESDDEKYFSVCGLACDYVFASIIRMLQDLSEGPIPIPINALLSIIARCFSTSIQKINPITNSLSLLLKRTQKNALNLLDHLVKVVQTNLAIYSHQIHQILVKALDCSRIGIKSKNSQTRLQNIYSLKQRVYESISIWFKSIGSNLLVHELWAIRILNHAYDDIKPHQETVELRKINSHHLPETKASDLNIESLNQFYESCLNATLNFLRQTITLLPDEQIQKAAAFFIQESLSVFNNCSKGSTYSSPISRQYLLEIINLLVQANESIPLNVAVNIFCKVLENEKNVDIKNQSMIALNCLNSYVNPKRFVRPLHVQSDIDILSAKTLSTGNKYLSNNGINKETKKLTTIIENVGPVSIENSTHPNLRHASTEPIRAENKDCLFVEETPNQNNNDESLSDISMVANTPNSTAVSNSDGLIGDAGSPASKSSVSVESSRETTSVSFPKFTDNGKCSSPTATQPSTQSAGKSDINQQIVSSSSNLSKDPRINKTKRPVNYIDLDQVDEDEDEDIFTIEMPKSIIHNSKRSRIDNNINADKTSPEDDAPEMEDIIKDFYNN